MKFLLPLLVILTCFGISQDTLYHSESFTITDNAVYEDDFEAIVVSPSEIKSNYESAFRPGIKRIVKFKFSINGFDNERPPSLDHLVEITPEDGEFVTPLFTFGESDPEEIDLNDINDLYIENTNSVNVLFRLDMHKVLRELATSGFYQAFDGSIIRKSEFKGVYIAGDEYPLSWNFSDLINHKEYKLTDADNDSIYDININFVVNPDRPIDQKGYSHWTLKKDISSYPKFESSKPLLNALYNLSLEELNLNIRPDSMFMAGAKWPGVWTRDISYSTFLSLAFLNPEVVKKSLLKKVKNDRIIQDTGTGGSWPVSTDRMTWSLAAWEIYLYTGDKIWLENAFRILKNSADADLKSIVDTQTGLFYGESSFLDWREQSYPKWMDPKDIYMSLNLGTNVIHYQTYNILHKMARVLGKPIGEYQKVASTIKNSINTYFWLAENGYYGQYIYGRNYKSLSQRSESLGEAFTVLFDIANDYQKRKVIANTPVLNYGIPCFFPQIFAIPSYHNNGIWPFVQAYWTWAAAKISNSKAVEYGYASIMRAATLFLTNKENYLASNGNYIGTEINSDRQLWSIAGNLAMVYRVLFGMQFTEEGLYFKPMIPKSFKGKYEINNFVYRNANFNISIEGFGSVIDSFFIDDNFQNPSIISQSLSGDHSIRIKMSNVISTSSLNIVDNHFTQAIINFELDDDELDWDNVDNDPVYVVYKNGKVKQITNGSDFELPEQEQSSEYQIMAIDNKGYSSFLTEPIWISDDSLDFIFQPDTINIRHHTAYEGYTGKGYIPVTANQNTKISFEINIPKAGFYSIDFKYANGNGPINTDNKCAIRTLLIDKRNIGIIVFPQRGLHQWTDWGYSNLLKSYLSAGTHIIELNYYDYNKNMNLSYNVAFIDHLRLRFLRTN